MSADAGRRVLFVAVESTRKCLGRMAENYLRRFSVRKIAVTGSAGKTTTVRLIASVLGRKFRLVESPRSYNNDIGVPKTIFTVGDGTELLVQEIGTNHPGEIAYLSGIVGQDCAVITNIGPAHVGFFGSLAEIAREKRSAIAGLPAGGFAFLNAEDRYFDYLRGGTAARVLSFGLERGDLFPERILEVGPGSVEFVLGGLDIRARLPGMHGVLDAVAAALVGRRFGLSFEEVREGIQGYSPEGGRGDVHEIGGVTLIDESYNANPLSVAASLEHLARIGAGGRRIVVFADMLELGEQAEGYHREVAARIVKSGVSRLLTFGELARAAGEACRVAGLGEVSHFSRIDELAARLKEDMEKGVVKRGDVILVKGSRAMRLDRVVRCLVGE